MITVETKTNPGEIPPVPPPGAGQEIFEHSPVGIAFVALDGRWLKVNDALCRIVGYSQAELLAGGYLELTHPDDLQSALDNPDRQISAENGTSQAEKRYLHRDGRTITVLLHTTLVRDGLGQARHLIYHFQDVTGRKRAEEEMIWKTAFFEAQMNSSLDGILVVDPKGKKILQNQRLSQLLKIPDFIANDPNDEKQIRWVTAMMNDPRRFIAKVVHLYAHPDERSRDEIELRNGTFLDRYSAPVTGADGVHYGRIWTFRDVTRRKRTEDSLRESEARYQRMAANVPGMVYQFTLRPDGTTTLPFVSEGCREIYGLETEQLRSNPTVLLEMVHPEDRADYEQSLAASAVSLDPWNWQGRIIRPGTGEVRCVQAASRPERQPNGDIIWDGVLVDITERRQADDHRRAREEAERTNQEKSKFLSRMSHELRTPLNAVLGFGQVLGFSPLQEQDALALSYIIKGGQHLLSLVDEVLDLSRAETGELHLLLREVDPAAVARECVGLLARQAAAHEINCTVKQPRCRVTLWCDEQRLRQVLLNLLSNAIKYNRAGGQVTVGFEPVPENRVRLSVSDTGAGISSQGIARLFMPFERLDHEHDGIEGTGLGLVVSRRIAEAMGGSVGVESQVGRGSRFWIELPLAPLAGDLVAGSQITTGVQGPVRETQSRVEVLYIEDNESNLQVVEMAIARRRPDWRFMSTRDGTKGLTHARRHLPDLILLDLQLPGISGEEVLEGLRGGPTTNHIPIIVLSADATLHTRERVLASGAHEYISKPFQIESFLRILDGALSAPREPNEERS